jgi:hypothetical protein
MGNIRYVIQMGGLIVLSLLGGCGGGGGGGTSGAASSATGPLGYGTCNITVGGQPSQCVSYTGSVYQNNITTSSTGCSGTGYTLTSTPSACSLVNSVGTCTITFGTATVNATTATTSYSTGGFTASLAQSGCTAVGGTYTNP